MPDLMLVVSPFIPPTNRKLQVLLRHLDNQEALISPLEDCQLALEVLKQSQPACSYA
jgi:hypothetical protein